MRKLLQALLVGVLYLALLGATYVGHVYALTVDVVFYAAIGDAVVAAAVVAALLYGTRLFKCFNAFEKGLLTVCCLLFGYTFAISVPTVIDRSLSFYILEKIQQRGGGIRQDRFNEVFTVEYLREHRLIDVRLTEQLASGTIQITDGCVTLTPRGQRLASMSRAFRQHLLPKQRLLMGQYSDALTDPFRQSGESPGYECSQSSSRR